MFKRNWFWSLITLLIIGCCYLLTVGIENFGFSESTRVFLLKNYFNIPNWYYFFAYFPLVFFIIFLIKAVFHKLKNRNANKILVFFNSFLILYVTYLTLKVNWINEKNQLDENTLKLWQDILHISLPIQFFLISVLVIVSWKGEKRSQN